MARKNGSGFKMKKSPAKGLSDFFSSLGKELKTGQKERGIFSEKGKAEKKEMRKTGESKYQYDVRKKREAKRKKADEYVTKTPEQQANINPKSEVKIDTKVGMDRYTYSNAGDYSKSKTTKNKKKVVKPKSNDGPRVSKVKKKPKTIKQDVAPTPGPLDPKYIPSKKDKELTFEDFQRITKGGDKKVVYAEYPGKPIIDWSKKIGKDITRRVLSGAAYLDELGGQPEIRSGIRKKSPSKKRGYKMKRK